MRSRSSRVARSAAMPWSISSRKKLSLPKMSWNSPAARSASSYCPSVRRVWISPDRQPVLAMIPRE